MTRLNSRRTLIPFSLAALWLAVANFSVALAA